MKVLSLLLVCIVLKSADAEYYASEMVMNILSQFLSTPTTETTTKASGILPKILNPLHWIPNFENIPWNPDSELTTVSGTCHLAANSFIFKLYADRNRCATWLSGWKSFCDYWRWLHFKYTSNSMWTGRMRWWHSTADFPSAWDSREFSGLGFEWTWQSVGLYSCWSRLRRVVGKCSWQYLQSSSR